MSIVGVIASAVLIYKINILMILLIILTCAAEFFLLRRLSESEKEANDTISKLAAKFDYFYDLSKRSEASKDIKIYGFGEYFIFTCARLAEYGGHSQLLNAGGKYSELWNAQAKYYTE